MDLTTPFNSFKDQSLRDVFSLLIKNIENVTLMFSNSVFHVTNIQKYTQCDIF